MKVSTKTFTNSTILSSRKTTNQTNISPLVRKNISRKNGEVFQLKRNQTLTKFTLINILRAVDPSVPFRAGTNRLPSNWVSVAGGIRRARPGAFLLIVHLIDLGEVLLFVLGVGAGEMAALVVEDRLKRGRGLRDGHICPRQRGNHHEREDNLHFVVATHKVGRLRRT